MSGNPPSPPGFTNPDARTKDERAYAFIWNKSPVNVSKPAVADAMSHEHAKQRLLWAEQHLQEAEFMLEYADSPGEKKRMETKLEKAEEILEDAHKQYDQASRGKGAAGLKPTESLTSATLGKSMGKGRKKKRTIRKKRSQKKRTLRR
jgi:hypothetical protein